MNVSSKLQSQLDRLQKTGAFSISLPEKKELQEHLITIGARPLDNLNCGVCVRNGMYDLINYLKQDATKPKLKFKGVKEPEELTYMELREAVKARGLLRQHMKKEEMIKALK